MAGLGFKDFQVGEVLTSSDVDGYLMQQTVMRFADEGARGSALGTAPGTAVALAEGMVVYLDDSNDMQVYTGTGWSSITSGIGRNAVQTVKTDAFSTTSSTLTPVTGVSVTITPSLASSKVLVMVSGITGNSTSNVNEFQLYRDATAIATSTGGGVTDQTSAIIVNTAWTTPLGIVYLDSPSTTSAVTYSLEARTPGGTLYVGRVHSSDRRGVTTVTAIEVTA